MIDVNKLILLKREIESERGPVCLFGLFLREHSAGYWDLLIAAPWASSQSWDDRTYLSQKVSERLKKSEMMLLSRFEIIDDDNPGLDDALKTLNVDDRITEIRNVDLFGHEIKQAYVLQAKRLPKCAAK
jgi:hypothetical protein